MHISWKNHRTSLHAAALGAAIAVAATACAAGEDPVSSAADPVTLTPTLTPTADASAIPMVSEVDQLKAGLWYVNLHTAAHPGGELRGHVK